MNIGEYLCNDPIVYFDKIYTTDMKYNQNGYGEYIKETTTLPG